MAPAALEATGAAVTLTGIDYNQALSLWRPRSRRDFLVFAPKPLKSVMSGATFRGWNWDTQISASTGDTTVLVYHLEDGFYATQANCTHTFGPLGRGKIVDGCHVRCPLHRAEFDVRTGEVHKWANAR